MIYQPIWMFVRLELAFPHLFPWVCFDDLALDWAVINTDLFLWESFHDLAHDSGLASTHAAHAAFRSAYHGSRNGEGA